MNRLVITEGDITKINVDAIVNSACPSLQGGLGVDKVIHEVAGPKLRQECDQFNGCEVGQAILTKGYKLPASYVIHTVGPLWVNGSDGEDQLLASCYRNSFELAVKHGVQTIAFPPISTETGYPVQRAARRALIEITNFLDTYSLLKRVIVVCNTEEDYQAYTENIKYHPKVSNTAG